MFGTYEIPLSIKTKDISIDIIKADYGYQYSRRIDSAPEFQKAILSERSKILINPVEPLNNPNHITNYLMLEFDKEYIIAPQQEKILYTTFPIEIGIFIYAKKIFDPIDIVSLLPIKYSLYGDPKNGIITRYHKASVYAKMPDTDPLREGVVQLTIKNSDSNWRKVTKLVLNAYGMKLHYSATQVKMYATMKINNEISAEADCYEPSVEKNYKKAMEIYQSRKLSLLTTKFIMLEGI